MRGSKKWDRLNREVGISLRRIYKAMDQQKAMLKARCGEERVEEYQCGTLYENPTLLMLFPESLEDALSQCKEHLTLREESAASMERMAAEGGAE